MTQQGKAQSWQGVTVRMFAAPDGIPCHGEEMHLTQEHTEGLFVEGMPQTGRSWVELAVLSERAARTGKGWNDPGIMPWLCP